MKKINETTTTKTTCTSSIMKYNIIIKPVCKENGANCQAVFDNRCAPSAHRRRTPSCRESRQPPCHLCQHTHSTDNGSVLVRVGQVAQGMRVVWVVQVVWVWTVLSLVNLFRSLRLSLSLYSIHILQRELCENVRFSTHLSTFNPIRR